MVTESTHIRTVLSIKANGKKISSMGKVRRYGLMELYTKEAMLMVRNKVKVSLGGLIAAPIKVNSTLTTSKVKVNTNGPMAESTKAPGSITRWKAKAFSPGLTVGSTKVNTQMTKNMATENSCGPMAEATKASGRMENSTESENIELLVDNLRLDSGRKERELSGFDKSLII